MKTIYCQLISHDIVNRYKRRSERARMNELLQKHGCANVFTIPEGLKELMADISREVLREQPKKINDFITNYLSVLLITREHGVMAVKILEELCDCRPSVSEHLLGLDLDRTSAETLAQIIKDEIESVEISVDKENIKESEILKKLLASVPLDEEMAANVCQIIRNAYKDYVYKKKLMEHSTSLQGDEPWQLAAERTLMLYKKTKPTLHELNRATERIQAAYRGYHVRRSLLKHLKPKKKKSGPQEAPPGPTPDIGCSREIDFGPVVKIKVREDNVYAMFEDHATTTLGLNYHPMTTLTHVEDDSFPDTPALSDRTKIWPHCTAMKTEIRLVQVDSRPIDSSRDITQDGEAQPLCSEKEAMDVFNEDYFPKEYTYSHTEHRGVGTPARKISFSTMPPELIPNEDGEDDQEIREAIQETLDDITSDAIQEIPEDIPHDIDGIGADDYSPVSSVASLSSADIADQDD